MSCSEQESKESKIIDQTKIPYKDLVEVIKTGIDQTAKKFRTICSTCNCEFKYCLNAISVSQYGSRPIEYALYCPECSTRLLIDCSKYQDLLKKRLDYTPESDF